MPDSNMVIQVTGSVNKALTALEQVRSKLTELQESFDRAAPSVAKFAENMDKIAAASNNWKSFSKMTESVNAQTNAARKAEAQAKRFQAQIDRATTSSERAKFSLEKLTDAEEKYHNLKRIPTPYVTGPQEEFTPPEDHVTPEMQASVAKSQAEADAFWADADARFAAENNKSINVDTSQAQANVQELGQFIDSLSPKMSGMSESAQAEFGRLSEELSRVGARMDTLRAIWSNLAQKSGEVASTSGEQSDAYLRLQKQMLSTADAYDRLSDKADKIKGKMQDVANSTDQASDSVGRFGRSTGYSGSKLQEFTNHLLTMSSNMLMRTAMFRLFSQAEQGVTKGLENLSLANSQANGTMSTLATDTLYCQNAFGAAFIPVLTAALPIINQVTDALTGVLNAIAMLSARIFNHASSVTIAKRSYVDYAKTINQSGKDSADVAKKEAENEAKAQAKATAAQESAAKKQAAAEERVQAAIDKHQKKIDALKKSVMGFDELNLLKDTTDTWTAPKVPDYTSNLKPASAYNTAATPQWNGLQSPTTMFETVKEPAWVKKVGAWTDKITAFIKANVDTIHRILIGVPFVIGAILAFSGANIPLGVALMAVGAVIIARQAKLDWNYLNSKTNSSLDKEKRALQIVGAVELAIGAIFAFSGANVGLGVALMIGGVMTTSATLNWDSISPKIRQAIAAIELTGAIAMLSIGAIFAFSGANIGLGVGMMVGGATTLWASYSLNWGSIGPQIKAALSTIAGIVGGFLFALGIMFIMFGNQPLGVGLAIAGAIDMVAAIAIDWNSTSNHVTHTIKIISGIVAGAALAIGVVLVCLGSVALGVGLIALGAAGLVAVSPIDWSFIPKKCQEILQKVTEAFKTAWEAVSKIWKSAGPWFGDRWKDIQNVFSSTGKWFQNIFGTAWNWVRDKWKGAGGWFGNRWNDIKGVFKPNMISNAMGNAWTWTQNIWRGAGRWFGDRWNEIKNVFKPNLISNAFQTAKENIQRSWAGLPGWFKQIGKNIANNIFDHIYGAMNGVINGINWVMGKVGSNIHVNPLAVPHYYASGTGGHPGGAAVVNDSAEAEYRELVQLPNGSAFIPKGRNVLIPDLPAGSKVLPAKETHTLFPHYAGGVGAFFGNALSGLKNFGTTMWQYISNPRKIFQAAVDMFTKAIQINEPWKSMGNAIVSFLTNHAADALKSIFQKFEMPSGTGTGVQRWAGIAARALQLTGHYTARNLQLLLAQMQTESGGNPNAVNRWDINAILGHPSQGLMQLIPSTFYAYALAPYNKSIVDPLSNIIASIRYTWSRYGGPEGVWGQGHGYKKGIGKIDFAGWAADGSLFTKPTLAGLGDNGAEAALPLNDESFEQIARGIVRNSPQQNNSNDTRQIINRMDKLEQAIKDIKVCLYTDDRKLAESVNRGNRLLGKTYPTA